MLTGVFATAFPITILSVVLAPIARSYGVAASVLTWAITGPFLVMAVCTPVFGKLGDTYGHRRLFLIGLAGSTAGALATAVAPTAAALIAFRIIAQGFGAAAQPTALALIMRVYPADQRAKATGWWSMVGAGALVIGLVIGGPLAQALGWRALFVVQAGITAASLLLALRILPRDQETQQDAGGSTSAPACSWPGSWPSCSRSISCLPAGRQYCSARSSRRAWPSSRYSSGASCGSRIPSSGCLSSGIRRSASRMPFSPASSLAISVAIS